MNTQRVLLMDDDEEVINALRQVLEGTGYELTVVKTLSGALAVLGEHNGDVGLVVTEIEPRAPGKLLLGAVQTCCEQLPVVVLTGLGDWDVYARTMGLGARAFVNKPASPDRLRMLFHRLCPHATVPEPVAEVAVGIGGG